MSNGRKTKTEHAGAKNGGGYWGKRVDAKKKSKRLRRQQDKRETKPAAAELQWDALVLWVGSD